MNDLGVYSEVGKLRKVLVHRPDVSFQRLTPSNHDDLLFDDVLGSSVRSTSMTNSSNACANAACMSSISPTFSQTPSPSTTRAGGD